MCRCSDASAVVWVDVLVSRVEGVWHLEGACGLRVIYRVCKLGRQGVKMEQQCAIFSSRAAADIICSIEELHRRVFETGGTRDHARAWPAFSEATLPQSSLL